MWNLSKMMQRKEVTSTSTAQPHEPHPDQRERAQQARSMVMQPFWQDMLWGLEQRRVGKLSDLRQPGTTWDDDCRKLAAWRESEDLLEFVINYPNSAIAEGGSNE